MDDLLAYVDPFHGNSAIDLPEPEGIAATWFFIKAQTGNTHPGACLPYCMMSACAHSGAYITGYGLNAPNTHARPPLRFDEYCASGFAHLHQSGTGSIGTYYNYALTTPLVGDLRQLGTRWALEDEVAWPGYYAATLAGTGIRAELAVGRKAALHRYAFPAGGPARIAVDISAGGIDFPRMRTFPEEAELSVLSPRSASAFVRMAGMPLYIYLESDEAQACSLWRANAPLDSRALVVPNLDESSSAPFGVLFEVDQGPRRAGLRLGFSLRSHEQARTNAQEVAGRSVDEVALAARKVWRGYIERIRVQGGSEAQRKVFYSCLYHSLVKPADFSGESPYWHDKPYWVDFATLWDQYKTALPLMLTCYPERGADAVNGLMAMGDHLGEFVNRILLNSSGESFDSQARGLTHHIIADAHNRHLPGIDWRHALELMLADLRKERNRDFTERGVAEPFTHTLDLADAAACTARLAASLGDNAIQAEMDELSPRWRNVYDPATARLSERSSYYEGGLWNYSFRLLHDMAGRIALYPSENAFVADLDRFFGYGAEPVRQPVEPGDREYMAWGHSLNRFEGYNNEPDMETPYAYLYAGRPDRTAEVVRAGTKYLYTTGRGGLPGNDDSGGLSSCYVWNAMGIFPVAGQPLMLIGSPIFRSVTAQIGQREFSVLTRSNSDVNVYVQRAWLNGEPIDRAYLTMDEVLAGGTLELEMGPEPSEWATRARPPSFAAAR